MPLREPKGHEYNVKRGFEGGCGDAESQSVSFAQLLRNCYCNCYLTLHGLQPHRGMHMQVAKFGVSRELQTNLMVRTIVQALALSTCVNLQSEGRGRIRCPCRRGEDACPISWSSSIVKAKARNILSVQAATLTCICSGDLPKYYRSRLNVLLKILIVMHLKLCVGRVDQIAAVCTARGKKCSL